MQKVEVLIKEELFKTLGLEVKKYAAYTNAEDDYIRINGEVYCTNEWDKDYCLKVMANLCNEEDEILQVDFDSDRKRLLKTGYDTFSICCYKGKISDFKYVEIYPKIE